MMKFRIIFEPLGERSRHAEEVAFSSEWFIHSGPYRVRNCEVSESYEPRAPDVVAKPDSVMVIEWSTS
ncbi:MAG: hypothetical protein ACREJQ_07110, partial [bacterium]